MADTDSTTTEGTPATPEARMDALVARFEAEDRKAGAVATADEDAADDAADSGSNDDEGSDDASSDDSEHTDEDTDDQSDGADGESDEDSDEDDDTDTDGEDADESDEESDDDEDGDADDQSGEGDEDDSAADGTKAALTKHGADLSLDDIPEKFRGIVEKKLKGIDAAYTRAAQEATSFRAKERSIRAEEKFRSDNPELVIVEMLRKGGDELFEKVNKTWNRIDPGVEGNDEQTLRDNAMLLDERIENRRGKAVQAIDAEMQELTAINDMASKVEQSARASAAKHKVPWSDTIDGLLEAAILRKAPAERAKGLTETEVDQVVSKFAQDHHRTTRANKRDDSRDRVKTRTENRRGPKPTVRPPKATASAGSPRPGKVKVDQSDPEARIRAMMKTAKRVMPGVK
jgi:hypothetical protein